MSKTLMDLDLAFNRLIRRYILAAILLLFAFIGVSVIWNNSIKQQLADQASLFIRRTLQSGDTRGELQILNGIRIDAFQSITQYDREGRRIVTLPPTVAPIGRGIFEQFVFAEIRSVIRLDDAQGTPMGTVTFVYSRFELVGYAALAWLCVVALVVAPIRNAKKKLGEELEKEIALQNSKLLKDLVGKVRHNIRSPLAVLHGYFTATAHDALTLKDQGRRAANRIEEILSEMEGGGEPAQTEKTAVAIFDAVALARQILEEKTFLGKVSDKIEIKSQVPCAYTTIEGRELKSTFSNILDNALQAVGELGRVQVEIEADSHLIVVSFRDNGKGMSPEILARVREQGFTHGKEGGSGLGLYLAEKLMENASGHLEIESELGKGTRVSLLFPQVPSPIWHCSELVLPRHGVLHICDDQEYILQAWQLKLSKDVLARTKLYASTEELPAEIGLEDRFLIDHDFGFERRAGLAAIRELANPAHAVLVTGRAHEAEIQAACVEAGCKLLSKDIIASFPVTMA